MYRLLATLLFAVPALAQCRLPDVAPDALARLSPSELVASGHYLRAAQILDPFVKSFPDDAPAAWLLSRAKAALGEFDDAMKLAETALAADPSNAAYHVQVAAVAGRIAEKASLQGRRLTPHDLGLQPRRAPQRVVDPLLPARSILLEMRDQIAVELD